MAGNLSVFQFFTDFIKKEILDKISASDVLFAISSLKSFTFIDIHSKCLHLDPVSWRNPLTLCLIGFISRFKRLLSVLESLNGTFRENFCFFFSFFNWNLNGDNLFEASFGYQVKNLVDFWSPLKSRGLADTTDFNMRFLGVKPKNWSTCFLVFGIFRSCI